ncbi:MAG: hypothetical protein ACRC7O_05695 [Fimbriiglobus sp.]
MRGSRVIWVAVLCGPAALGGCKHTVQYDTSVPVVEEFHAAPNEDRFNQPPEKTWRPPPVKKDFKPGMGGPNGPGPGMGGGGGPGGR